MKAAALALAAAIAATACASDRHPRAGGDLIANGGAAPASFAHGADVGWVTEMEAAGRVFRDRAGRQDDLFAILKAQGIDAIRLRVWVNPAGGWNALADTLAKARRARAAGMRLMLDFHYSDSWADPAKQTKPAAWAAYDLAQLADAVAVHTRATLEALRAAGITPTWVQVGNETRNGMLWPDGEATRHMDHYALFVERGYRAVKDVFPDALVLVHVDNCHDGALFRWNFDGLTAHGAHFDMIGASSYPTTAKGMDWQAATAACEATLKDVKERYGKPVMLSEIGVPWDHPQGQAIVADLLARARRAGAGGAFYWEPEAYDWKGYPMGAFDHAGKPTPVMDAFLKR